MLMCSLNMAEQMLLECNCLIRLSLLVKICWQKSHRAVNTARWTMRLWRHKACCIWNSWIAFVAPVQSDCCITLLLHCLYCTPQPHSCLCSYVWMGGSWFFCFGTILGFHIVEIWNVMFCLQCCYVGQHVCLIWRLCAVTYCPKFRQFEIQAKNDILKDGVMFFMFSTGTPISLSVLLLQFTFINMYVLCWKTYLRSVVLDLKICEVLRIVSLWQIIEICFSDN